MSVKQRVEKLAAALDVDVVDDSNSHAHSISLHSSAGKKFFTSDCHTAVAWANATGVPKSAMWALALEDLTGGLVPCDLFDCNICDSDQLFPAAGSR